MVNLYNLKIQIEVICILIKVWRERLFLNAGFLSTFFLMTSSREPSVTLSTEQDVRFIPTWWCVVISSYLTHYLMRPVLPHDDIPLTVLEADYWSNSWLLANQMAFLMDLFQRVQKLEGTHPGSTAQLVGRKLDSLIPIALGNLSPALLSSLWTCAVGKPILGWYMLWRAEATVWAVPWI